MLIDHVRFINNPSNMAPGLPEDKILYLVLFFFSVSKPLLGIEGQMKRKNLTILARKTGTVKHRTWPINNNTLKWHVRVTS